jgi:hypothetical protein
MQGVDDAKRYEHAVIDYARAAHRTDVLHRAWQRASQPVLGRGGPHGRVTTAHPLLVALERAEDHSHALAASLGLTPDGYRKVKPRMGRPKEIVPPLPGAHRLRPVE